MFNPHYGLLGLIGIPVKVFNTVRSLFGVGAKAYTAYLLSAGHQFHQLLALYLLLTVIHFALDLLLIYIVRPVAHEPQGSCQWFLLPIFSSVYQPILSCVRVLAIAVAIKQLISNDLRQKHFKRRPGTLISKINQRT
ncbi:MAG TPA: hypothetical protein VFK27_06980 [Bacillales bacterium]|nr:hypothetical protein [Bacillales bacterium]